jgi:integrase
MRLTKSAIAKLQPPTTGQVFYRDDTLKGFAIRVTAGGTKSFVLEKLIERKVRRVTLGRSNEISVETARRSAQKMLGQIADGRNPLTERRRKEAAAITLDTVFAAYLEQRRDLKPKSVADYTRAVTIAFADWRRRPLVDINRDAVARRFKKLRDENGPAWANLCMRVLRALFNFAAGQYADDAGQSPFASNPVKVLSQTKAWAKVDRRKTVIKPHELARWYAAVNGLTNKTVGDYLILLLFTGLRKGEGARLRWTDIDFEGRTLTIADTKSGRPHTLPLPPFILDMLAARQRLARQEFVFAGEGAGGYLVSPKKAMWKVIEASGVAFTLHDLRRTFSTIAESLDIPAYALKRLLNHADGADVTAGYIVVNAERLREPMQKIADYLLRAMEIEPTEVYSFEEKAHATRQTVHSE